jgi:hypothetical protein
MTSGLGFLRGKPLPRVSGFWPGGAGAQTTGGRPSRPPPHDYTVTILLKGQSQEMDDIILKRFEVLLFLC